MSLTLILFDVLVYQNRFVGAHFTLKLVYLVELGDSYLQQIWQKKNKIKPTLSQLFIAYAGNLDFSYIQWLNWTVIWDLIIARWIVKTSC